MNNFSKLVTIFSAIILFQGNSAIAAPETDLGTLLKSNEKLIDRLDTLEKQGHQRYISKELPPLVSEVPEVTHKIQAALTKGALVKSLTDKSYFYIKKRVFVWGLINEKNPYTFIVLDKDGNPKFETETRYVIPIKDDISIGANPLYFTPVKETVGSFTLNKKLNIRNYLSLGIENINYQIAKQYNGGEDSQTMATRGELRSYFPFKFPIIPGIALSFQRGLGNGETSSYSWMAFEIGPTFRYRAYSGKKHAIDLSLFAGRSLYYQAEFEDQVVGLQTNFAGLSIEDVYSTSYGGFTLGAEARIIDVKNTGSTVSQNIEERNMKSMSFALFVGKEINLSL